MKIACMNIDRLVSVQIRSNAMPRNDLGQLMKYLNQDGPVSYQIAQALLAEKPGSKVCIFTGAQDPTHYPNGESDGPLGAVCIARALEKLGHSCTIFSEEGVVAGIKGIAAVLNYSVDARPLPLEYCEQYDQIAQEYDIFFSTEKQGMNSKGIPHAVSGTSRAGQRCKVDLICNAMNNMGKLTIGVGDGGNEIGFGKIYKETCALIKDSDKCRCGCGGGIVTVTATKYLYPVAISNWGCYAIIAALAICSGRKDLAVTPLEEHEMLKNAVKLELGDGGSGKFYYAVDGVAGEASAAFVTLLRELVMITGDGIDRGF